VKGDSVSHATLAKVRRLVGDDHRCVAILDSDHRAEHVLTEMRTYAPLVGLGYYLIVEDTNVNGNPVVPEFGPGPREAVAAFLAEQASFVVDDTREKFGLTFNPGGYLKRVSDR
jgi:cephalosporin hydroxylase